jgi:Uma2 family endonuclease
MVLFTTERYDAMVRQGIFTSDDAVELLENHLVRKMPRNPPHDGTLDLILSALRCLPTGWFPRVQQTLALSDSRPEPDFAVVRGHARSYLAQHPEPNDVSLVIEVANTSLLRDQRDKSRIYARAGIVCYWIVNLEDRRIEVHTAPSGECENPCYASVVNYNAGDSVPLVIAGNTVATILVSDLLP